MAASDHCVSPAPGMIVQQSVSPIPGVSVTQQVSFLDNYLAQYIPSAAPLSNPNYLTGYIPGELSKEELFDVYGDNLTVNMLLDNDEVTGI